MKAIGFPISRKENEKRRAILPRDIARLLHRDYLHIEQGYGAVLGVTDQAYIDAGAHVVSHTDALQLPIVCSPKNPTTDEQSLLGNGQVLFGWIHAVQGRAITDLLVSRQMTAIAWEDMFDRGLHVFWENNEISGCAAVMHSFTLLGRCPWECKVALIGRGNVGRGAYKTLAKLGAQVTTYDRKTAPRLRSEIEQYDVVINAVLWDVFRQDHLVYREDLARMKPGAMIVDISCDEAMGIETSHPTTIERPTYLVDGILHYAVDHTPALLYQSASEAISSAVAPFLDDLVEEAPNQVLEQATIIRDGVILDDRILRFQGRQQPTLRRAIHDNCTEWGTATPLVAPGYVEGVMDGREAGIP